MNQLIQYAHKVFVIEVVSTGFNTRTVTYYFDISRLLGVLEIK